MYVLKWACVHGNSPVTQYTIFVCNTVTCLNNNTCNFLKLFKIKFSVNKHSCSISDHALTRYVEQTSSVHKPYMFTCAE